MNKEYWSFLSYSESGFNSPIYYSVFLKKKTVYCKYPKWIVSGYKQINSYAEFKIDGNKKPKKDIILSII